jgi:hypothetical protein
MGIARFCISPPGADLGRGLPPVELVIDAGEQDPGRGLEGARGIGLAARSPAAIHHSHRWREEVCDVPTQFSALR